MKRYLDKFRTAHIDLSFKILKLLLKHVKRTHNFSPKLSEYFLQEVLPSLRECDAEHCKVIEFSLKLAYLFLKQGQKQANFGEDLLIDGFYHKFKVNSNILAPLLKIIAFKMAAEPENQELVAFLVRKLFEHSNSEEKELVRIAAVKALAKVIPVVKSKNELFPQFVSLLRTSSLLLNDENPEIRAFISLALSSLLFGEFQVRISGHESSIALSDAFIHKRLFLKALESASGDKEKVAKVLTDLLLVQILEPAYREHVKHNFDDKIFFFEPVNKFYDLVEVQQLAFEAFEQGLSELPDKAQIAQHLQDRLKNTEQSGIAILSPEVLNEKLQALYKNGQTCLSIDNMQYEQLYCNVLVQKCLELVTGERKLAAVESAVFCRRLAL